MQSLSVKGFADNEGMVTSSTPGFRFQNNARVVGRLMRLMGAALLIGLLAACASPISAKVTNFNAWPADAAGSSFSFSTSDTRTSDLEQATYENYVGVELQRRGLTLAPSGQRGRFLVDVTTVETTRDRKVLEPVYDNQLIFVPPYRYGTGDVFPGYYRHDRFGPRYIGDREVIRTVQVSRLKVRLLDARSPTPKPRAVFESTAVYEGDIEDLPDTVPYLVTAVFDGFPGQNGRVRVVKFDSRTGDIKR
ncbi:DUF4136 domain-containing protein [soil metagenome]